MKTILVTGAAGFIGFYLCREYIRQGYRVVGVDSLNNYYSVELKLARLALLQREDAFTFHKLDITDKAGLDAVFQSRSFHYVVHMAAQAGVRYSIDHPRAYIDSNLVGFFNMLEACRAHRPEHFLYASSSSVYGLNSKIPFSESDGAGHPVSLYAATKRCNELMAHSYSVLYDLPVTGLRFFTVYGPWGRPDMALFSFTRAILEGQAIKVFNNGNMSRDFTYIDDIVSGVTGLTQCIPPRRAVAPCDRLGVALAPDQSPAPFAVYNLGNGNPVSLLRFVEILESVIGKPALKEYLPMQPGDVERTFADISALKERTGYSPRMPIEEGVEKFVSWYREFYTT